jgi:carboxymethylenebutenolidase
MCFDVDSSPPIPPISGAAVSHQDLELDSADGTRFAAFAATPDEPAGRGVVILPDVRGLYRFYEELALRFAERDIAAVTIDYFGRTAGAQKRGEDFEWMPHLEQTEPETIQQDVGAAVAWLREHGVQDVFTVGFCFGGRNSWLAAASGHRLAGAIGFYGSLADRMLDKETWVGPLSRASEMKAPILALQAGDDAHITPEQNAAFDAALTDAGVEHEVVTYDGAPHSFFDRKQEEFQDASDDAWRRVLEFIDRHS